MCVRIVRENRKTVEEPMRYLSSLDELVVPLLVQAGAVGMGAAERWIALSDGGSGLENFFRVNFPSNEIIPDFYHAEEHVCEFAKVFSKGHEELKEWHCEAW